MNWAFLDGCNLSVKIIKLKANHNLKPILNAVGKGCNLSVKIIKLKANHNDKEVTINNKKL